MTVPVISPVPPAPVRADAPADYSTKADTFAAALPVLASDINGALSFINENVTTAIELSEANLEAAASGFGNRMYDTAAEMNADLSPVNGLSAIVMSDPDAAKNGWYYKSGASGTGSWVRLADQPANESDVDALEVRAGRAESDIDALKERATEAESRSADSDEAILAVVDSTGFAGFEVKDDSIKTVNVELSIDSLRMGEDSVKKTDAAAFRVVDENDFVVFEVSNEGQASVISLNVSGQVFEYNDDFSFAVVDEHGFVGLILDATGSLIDSGGTANASAFSDSDIALANQSALASAFGTAREFNSEVARPLWEYNHFLEYGQSLSTGFQGPPALSKTPRLGNLMLGNSVRPADSDAAEFVPIGGNTLQPLKAVVQSIGGSTILTDEQIADLSPGASNEGEASIVGMTNFAKFLHNQRIQTLNDQAHVFVACCCGVAGRSIEELSKAADPDIYLRLVQAAQKVKEIATTEGKSYGISAVMFLQGEWNYQSNNGTANKSQYKALLAQLYSDIENDIVQATADQTAPPLFMTYQTGAGYTRDDNDLSIGMAQWELSEERRNWVLATPAYPYPDHGGHLTSNGYRWMGKQFAKVWHRVVELGQAWKPLSPLSIKFRERDVLVTFHVPHPPLMFDTPYVLRTATDYSSKGFSFVDDLGAAVVLTAEIVADCVVKLTLPRDPVGSLFIRYADKTYHNGGGCLRDSDPTISDDVYEYSADTCQYADENIPELVGKPYPLHNWCIAFHLPATNGE